MSSQRHYDPVRYVTLGILRGGVARLQIAARSVLCMLPAPLLLRTAIKITIILKLYQSFREFIKSYQYQRESTGIREGARRTAFHMIFISYLHRSFFLPQGRLL